MVRSVLERLVLRAPRPTNTRIITAPICAAFAATSATNGATVTAARRRNAASGSAWGSKRGWSDKVKEEVQRIEYSSMFLQRITFFGSCLAAAEVEATEAAEALWWRWRAATGAGAALLLLSASASSANNNKPRVPIPRSRCLRSSSSRGDRYCEEEEKKVEEDDKRRSSSIVHNKAVGVGTGGSSRSRSRSRIGEESGNPTGSPRRSGFAPAVFLHSSLPRFVLCEGLEQGAVRQVVVGKESDFPDGGMRQVKIPSSPQGAGEGAVLVARVSGQLYATGASCSHYSAPLVDGVLAADCHYVVCPWHNAAFDLRTGQPVRGAGFQAIPTYPISVTGEGSVVVEVPHLMEDFAAPRCVRRSQEDERLFLVVGGGAAGLAAGDALRQEGFQGRLVILTEERHLPYDRPVLSKNLAKASEVSSISLRDEDYLRERDIEVRRGTRVAQLDASTRTVKLASGEELRYDAALVASGAKPRTLPIRGADLPGVLLLRTPEDAQAVAALCKSGGRAVVVGSSFIGMEIAATLRRRGCEVTVLGMEAAPFERVLGLRLGLAVKKFFESKGVRFLGKATCKEIRESSTGTGTGGLVVLLQSGEELHCDAVVTGVGVVPNASFVEGAEKAKDGSLLTDEFLETTATGLFAAGDVATYRSPMSGQRLRVEHWDVATSQGRAAARAMLGKRDGCGFNQTPFFWTSLFGKNLRYVGHCAEFDELIVDGNLEQLNFVAFYCFQGSVRAVATMARDPIAVAAGELMRMGRMPSAEELKAGLSSSAGLLQELRKLCQAS